MKGGFEGIVSLRWYSLKSTRNRSKFDLVPVCESRQADDQSVGQNRTLDRQIAWRDFLGWFGLSVMCLSECENCDAADGRTGQIGWFVQL